jgi:ATP-binding cassette subfamily F protein uup
VITHDRRFLDSVVLEIANSIAAGCACSGQLHGVRAAQGGPRRGRGSRPPPLRKFWAQEEVWIARASRRDAPAMKGRVKRLEHLREERAARRERSARSGSRSTPGERSGKLVANSKTSSKSFDDKRACSMT